MENSLINSMSDNRAYQYIHSRGYVRHALSQVFKKDPLKIPLNALPNLPPKLPVEYGHVSFSHCKDILLVAWSFERLGVDVERADRKIHEINHFVKFFQDEMRFNKFKSMNPELLRSEILNYWVLKESLVKWENSSLFFGLRNWKLSVNNKFAKNKKSGAKVKIQKINFNDWKIGIASNHHRNYYPLQVCL